MINHGGDGNYLVINTSRQVSISWQTVPPHGSLAVSDITDQIRQAAIQSTIGIKDNRQQCGGSIAPATGPATGTNQLTEIQRLDTLATSIGNSHYKANYTVPANFTWSKNSFQREFLCFY